jgi:CDP-glycerol glycerophosphotransferase
VPLDRLPGVRQVPGLLGRRRDDTVLFESWHGAYSDNPRAIAEALHEHRPGVRQLWAARDGVDASLPDWATPVRPGGGAYLAALGRARWVVANTHMPGYFRKRRGTTYVQTWHGTPLKRVGLDIERVQIAGDYLERLREDVAKWDVLLSPNPFSTPIFRRAFAYPGRVLETGYPRNDLLASPEAGRRERAAVRRRLGIADGTLAILYAPTWRDGAEFTLRLDIGALRTRVGRDHVVLVRMHPLVTLDDAGEHALDVSAHGDIRDLYLAADVLVTDYSSAMFDFAVTGKPMLFFTYDLAEYRDVLRGFYFDFEREAPGPLLATTEEVAEALSDLDAVAAGHADRYAAFRRRFAPLDDGHAAERVVEAVFSA